MREANEPLTEDMVRFFNATYLGGDATLSGVMEGCDHIKRKENHPDQLRVGYAHLARIGTNRFLALCDACYATIAQEVLVNTVKETIKELAAKDPTALRNVLGITEVKITIDDADKKVD